MIFWAVWLFSVIFSSLVFLNFIIAEVSNSYTKVKDQVESLIYKERAMLIAEAEALITQKSRNKQAHKFPEYIVSRRSEE